MAPVTECGFCADGADGRFGPEWEQPCPYCDGWGVALTPEEQFARLHEDDRREIIEELAR